MRKGRAKKRGCSCEKCQECCKREPGWFLPDEIAQAASYLNIREEEFVKHYCAEHLEDDVYTLSPKQKPNSKECIFFNREGLCDIHEVRPHECRKVFGCAGPNRHRRIREIIKRQWK